MGFRDEFVVSAELEKGKELYYSKVLDLRKTF